MVKKLVLIFLILMQPVYSQTFFGKYYKAIFTTGAVVFCIGYILKLRSENFGLRREAWRQEQMDLDYESHTIQNIPSLQRVPTTVDMSDYVTCDKQTQFPEEVPKEDVSDIYG